MNSNGSMLQATWLTAVATFFAAIAAGFSVWATLSAAYDNSLYNKQIETFGSIIAVAASIDSSVDACVQFPGFAEGCSIDGRALLLYTAHQSRPTTQVDTAAARKDAALTTEVASLQQAVQVFRLTAPSNLDPLLQLLSDDATLIASQFHGLADSIHDPTNANFSDVHDSIASIVVDQNIMQKHAATLFSCLRPIFEAGKYLTPKRVQPCVSPSATSKPSAH